MNIKIALPLFLISILLMSCSDDKNTLTEISENIENAAIIRTMSFDNSDFIRGELNSVFNVNLEVQDEENGTLMTSVDVFVRFKDNTVNGNNISSQEVLLKTLDSDEFINGLLGLPTISLDLMYSELVAATNISSNEIACTDQFLIRLKLNLSDGRSFTNTDGQSSSIIAFDTASSSPFCYTINITDAVPTDLFLGQYRYTSVIDGPIGPTFGLSKVVQITRGNSVNSRVFLADYIVSRPNEASRPFRFVIACDELIFRKNQLSSFFSWCRHGDPEQGFSFGGPPILLGPDSENSTINPNDDSSFELTFVEGYLGWDGECNYGTVPVKIIFTRE